MSGREGYAESPGLNFSRLKALAVSPLHYRYGLEHERSDTSYMGLGRAVHCAVLEPDEYERRFAVYPGAVRRGKEWDAFQAANEGRDIIKADEFDKALSIAAAVRMNPHAALLLSSGVAEAPIHWTDAETGRQLKGVPDFVSDASVGAVLDLKAVSDLHPARFAAQAARMHWHTQLAMYLDGLHAIGRTSVTRAIIIAVETVPPYDVVPYLVGEDSLFRGQTVYRGWLKDLANCERLDQWPGRASAGGLQELVLPAWAWPSEDDVDATEPAWAVGAGEAA